jgi:phosphocarrier protein HPr
MPPIKDIVISNKLGLHARAAAKLTHLASKFESEIFIALDARRVNAKSIMGVMMLAAGLGVTVKLEASGKDADQALDELQALFDSKFGENE